MAKKLYMTTADYLVIAVSPALIMALVGSLVYFLIDVFYAGEYEVRLDYAFGLFVFAAVLIARISIEGGREYAAMFALPLGVAMFLVLLKFVEHPSPFSHIINLLLMCLVWWCADRLTWDSTVIDDDEDASGEGLMQRIGVDGPEPAAAEKAAQNSVPDGAKENELLEAPATSNAGIWQRLKGFARGRKGPHTPGIWVFYFSMAALPLFGVGQHWIPAEATGRRRYAFFLLLVYVASALTLLVTTSFLNLRRYLRQRRVEMPLPIAGTWVGVGAVLIAIAMMLAMLIPRPGAEVAISQVPWQARSPEGMSASRTSVYRDGGEQAGDQQNPTGGEREAEDGQGNLPPNGKPSDNTVDSPDGKKESGKQGGKGSPTSAQGKKGQKQDGTNPGESSDNSQQKVQQSAEKKGEGDQADGKGEPNSAKGEKGEKQEGGKEGDTSKRSAKKRESSPMKTAEGNKPNEPSATKQNKSDENKQSDGNGSAKPSTPPLSHPIDAIRSVSSSLGGLVGLLKILFYIVAATFVGFMLWKHRQRILQALSDILRQLRELFGGRRATDSAGEGEKATTGAPQRRFSDFRDPFLTGQHGQMPPEELVRYTFAAFEAWANDRGRPRTPDCTPQELLQVAVEPKTPLHAEARKLVRMYGELAYASRRVPREAANELRDVWLLMQRANPADVGGVIQR